MELIWFLLLTATGLVLVDLALLVHARWTKAQVRRAFTARVKRDLARDLLIHDRLRQMPLPEEASDYLSIMAEREEQERELLRTVGPSWQ